MPSVPIPAEIVGDTKTLRDRRDDLDQGLLASAICLGRYANSYTEPGHRAKIIGIVARRDVLTDEIDRRWIARGLAR